jgi:hypothetical protein
MLGHGSDFAPILFRQFLWRARCWTGRNVHAVESGDEIIGEFRDRSITASSPETVPLYAARLNRFGSTLTLLPGDGHTVTPLPIRVSHRASDLPFAIRQPISQGIGFFLYADKYTSLVTELLDAKHPESEVRAFASFYREVMDPLSIYLRELFLLASVMYVDQFGYQQLLRFALWMEHVLGALRISKQSIFKQAPLNLLKDEPLNLLDVIASAYRPEDVIAHLISIHWVNAEYDKEKIEADGKGVQATHKRRVQNYYNQHTSLKNKAAWITDAFITKKLT